MTDLHPARNTEIFDIAIVGSGLVGASLALLLARTPFRVVQIEAKPPFQAVTSAESTAERYLALNALTVRQLSELGVLPSAEATSIAQIHISRQGEFGHSLLRANDFELAEFGRVVPASSLALAFEKALQSLTQAGQLTRITGCAQAFSPSSPCAGISVTQSDGGAAQTIRARLVVAADGTDSALRTLAGIDTRLLSEEALCALVFNVQIPRDHQGCAVERFTDAGPIALLPLPGHQLGVVWTMPSIQAERRTKQSEPDFLDDFQSAFGFRLGRFSKPGKRTRWPIRRLQAMQTTAGRLVLIGNAAQTVHPIGAQGFNLGLRDALALRDWLLAQSALDFGQADLLENFAELRKKDRDDTVRFSENLLRATRNVSLPAKLLRGAAMGALAHLPFAQLDVIRFGMGHTRQTMVTPPIEANS